MEDMWSPAFKIRNNKNTKKRAAEIDDAGRNTPQKMAMRAKIVLLAGTGEANHAIAQKNRSEPKNSYSVERTFPKERHSRIKRRYASGAKAQNSSRHGAACYRYDASEEAACGNTLEQSNTWEGVEYF